MATLQERLQLVGVEVETIKPPSGSRTAALTA
jgi:hypothetical protein